MIQLIICKGLPASGKSTWAKQWVLEEPNKRIRVNRDDIRNMLGPYWLPSREKLVTSIENNCISAALLQGYSVVVDATNFKHNFDWRWVFTRTGIKEEEIEILEQDFTHISVDECIKRDELRENGKVGKDVIVNMAKKYLNDKV